MDIASFSQLTIGLWIGGVALEIILGTLIAYRESKRRRVSTFGSFLATALYAVCYGLVLAATDQYPGVQIGIAIVSVVLMCWVNHKLAVKR